jgi:hypothetical protein
MGFSTAVKKSSPKTESKACIKDSASQSSVSSHTELSISGKYSFNFRGYDAGKQFIWGTEQ